MNAIRDVTEAQQEAIHHVRGPLLVLAGAGSGKTLVITRRIAHLIDQGVPPDTILAITFTNKAAGEMRERVESLTGLSDVWISTFHSFSARLLRRHIDRLGFTHSFTIYDTVDQIDCVKEAMRELEIDTSQWKPSIVAARISHVKNMMIPPSELETGELFDSIVARVHKRYAEILRESNALDFDDLLLHLLRLFDEHPDLLRTYQRHFQFVLIDEYQDTNRPQYLMARALAEGHGNLCATGDPDQSIYAWRGADIHNILNFEADFPGAHVVKLEQNFRSTGRILEAASGVIAHNRHRKPKTLRTENPVGDPVLVVSVADEMHEANVIAGRIIAEIALGRSPGDIAIFFRTNALSRSLERALIEKAIPYTIVGTVEFFRRREIKDLVAYLRVCENPSDSPSLERILNVPRRGIGAKALSALRDHARAMQVPMLEAMASHESIPGLASKSRAGVRAFLTLMTEIAEYGESPVAEQLHRLIELVGYRQYLAHTDSGSAEEREENVDELVAAAAEYDRRNPDGTLAGFLQEVALLSDVDKWEQDEPRVTLMTLHAAKGLEFPVVFIAGVEEGLLPHQRSIDQDDDVEEERRLFHVGMTRARERLILMNAALRTQYGTLQPCIPSRFLREIPEEAKVDESLLGTTASASFVPEPPPVEDDFQAGDVVQHQYFGIGTIVSLVGEGAQRRVVVRFENGDERKLILEFAKLCKID